MTLKFKNVHDPVLYNEVHNFLIETNSSCNHASLNKDRAAFEGTFGGGGHTNIFLNKGFKVYTCDLDVTAIENGLEKFEDFVNLGRVSFLHKSFDWALEDFNDDFFDAILVDLGYSSNQLEFSDRGFSYQKKQEDFDLRYDINDGVPAFKVIQEAKSEAFLSKIIFNNSGETFARKIAFELFQKRCGVRSVESVENIVLSAIPKSFLNKKNAILSRVWQAFRIEVNREFETLQHFLEVAPKKLKKSGRLGVICFNSLEDKMVTKAFRDLAKAEIIDDFGNKSQNFKMLTKKAVVPGETELLENVRSRSATFRVLEKL